MQSSETENGEEGQCRELSTLSPEERLSVTVSASVDVRGFEEDERVALAETARSFENAFMDVYESVAGNVTHGSDVPDDVVHEVVEGARSLSGEDERVTVVESVHDVLGDDLGGAWLSSQLFTADVVDASRTSADVLGGDTERGLIHVELEKAVTFAGYGDGFIRFGIAADGRTRGIEAVSVAEVLSAETQRQRAN